MRFVSVREGKRGAVSLLGWDRVLGKYLRALVFGDEADFRTGFVSAGKLGFSGRYEKVER